MIGRQRSLHRCLQDCNDRRPASHTADGDQFGPLRLIQAPRGREPGEAAHWPFVQSQLDFGRSIPTRREPAGRRNLKGFPPKPRVREPPAPTDRPAQRPTPRPGVQLREIKDGDRQHATRLPGGRQQPGQLSVSLSWSCGEVIILSSRRGYYPPPTENRLEQDQ